METKARFGAHVEARSFDGLTTGNAAMLIVGSDCSVFLRFVADDSGSTDISNYDVEVGPGKSFSWTVIEDFPAVAVAPSAPDHPRWRCALIEIPAS